MDRVQVKSFWHCVFIVTLRYNTWGRKVNAFKIRFAHLFNLFCFFKYFFTFQNGLFSLTLSICPHIY
jgi:hypothetical protein